MRAKFWLVGGMDRNILELKELKTFFFTPIGVVKAVNGVSFSLKQGETLGLVGESGCGKSMTALSIVRLVPPPGRIIGGEIRFDGQDLLKKSEGAMRQIRGKQISMILQDPMTSLNPVLTIGDQVTEPIIRHQGVGKPVAFERAKEILHMLSIPAPEMRLSEYAHQMSGGMRQRVVGAMALSCQPSLLIADEPTTSLDVTTQVLFLSLLKGIQQKSGLSMILVTHDFGIVAKCCQRVAVMYAGKIVEIGDLQDILDRPAHPYTIALIKSLPSMRTKTKRLYSIKGQPPNPIDLPHGCSFESRCSSAMEICSRQYPPDSAVENNHLVSCWLRTATNR